MSILDPKPFLATELDAAVRDKINDTTSATRGALGIYVQDSATRGASVNTAARLSAIEAGQASPASGTNGVTVGMVRRDVGVYARYAAFPWVTKLPDRRLFMVWYEATDHAATRDGIIRASYSSDGGRTWGAAFTALSTPSTDLRDPTVSVSADGLTVYLTYFKGSAANAAEGFFIRRSTDNGLTYGPEYRIDTHEYAAGCGPVVTLSNGTLLATWYGKVLTTDARDSVWVATSTNGGTTWTAPAKIVDGIAPDLDMQEPCPVVTGNTVIITYRRGNSADIGIIKSTDSGATWGAPATAFPGTGRPGTIITTAGTLICVYRSLGSGLQQHGLIRTSNDLGTTWTGPHLVEQTVSNFWVYSGMVENSPGQVLCVSAVESSSTTCEMSSRYLTEGAGISPFGDVALPPARRVTSRATRVAAVDDFDRPNKAFLNGDRTSDGRRWNTDGTGSIVDSALQDATGTPHPHWIKALSTSMEVEAEMMWTTTSGVALLARVQDTSNYLMATIETTGTNARIYKVVAGTATQLATAATSCPAGVWHRFRFTAVGDNLRFYIEDSLVASVTDATFNNQGGAGVRTGATSATHRVRNFAVRRRSEINV